MNFNLKRPCKDCPFVDGGVELSEERFQGIVYDLIRDDQATFYCHKTIDYDNQDEGTGEIAYNGDETACMGALAYVRRHHGRLPIAARIALAAKIMKLEDIEASEALTQGKRT